MLNPNSSNIFLIGPMGSGKTTVGRQVAKMLDKVFYDSDKEIEQRSGVKVSLIFDIEGEAGFRVRERRILGHLTVLNNIVLATGGGAILDEENRARLRSRGLVVYLKVPIEQLYHRVAKDQNRPLLQTESPRDTLLKLVREREPLYRETADLIVNSNRRSVRHVVRHLCHLIARHRVVEQSPDDPRRISQP